MLRPHPLLAGVVKQIWHGEGRVAYARDRILPGMHSYLLLNLGPPQFHVVSGPPRSRVVFDDVWFSGISELPIDAEAPHGSCVVGVALTTTGAARLLPWPQWELANSIGPLVDLLGPEPARLRERLLNTSDATERLVLVQDWLIAACMTGRSIHPLVHWAAGRLAESGGTIRADALAREAGCSRKHLNDLFRRQVGLPPKTLARIHRFRRALEQVQRGPERPWSELAYVCGYYDQSHLIHDFRQFAGMSPAELARRAMPDSGSVVLR